VIVEVAENLFVGVEHMDDFPDSKVVAGTAVAAASVPCYCFGAVIDSIHWQ